VIAFVLGRALIVENEGLGIGRDIDVLGSVLVTVAMMLGVYGIVTSTSHGWGSAHTIGFVGAGAALLAAFVLLESRLRNPIMPLRIFRVKGLAGSSVIRAFLVTGMFASFFMGVLYLEHVLGYGTLKTGLAFLPMTLVLATLSMGITARFVTTFGPRRPLLVGLAFAIASLVMLSQASADAAYFPYVFIAFLLLGVGAGMAFLPLLTIAMAEVPAADAGLASGIINVSVQIAGALGLAILGTIATDHTRSLTAHGHDRAGALLAGYHLAFVVGAIAVGVGVLVAILALHDPRRTRPAQAPVAEPEAA
jgi:predicted MFS family arabinose efflux permease